MMAVMILGQNLCIFHSPFQQCGLPGVLNCTKKADLKHVKQCPNSIIPPLNYSRLYIATKYRMSVRVYKKLVNSVGVSKVTIKDLPVFC